MRWNSRRVNRSVAPIGRNLLAFLTSGWRNARIGREAADGLRGPGKNPQGSADCAPALDVSRRRVLMQRLRRTSRRWNAWRAFAPVPGLGQRRARCELEGSFRLTWKVVFR